MLKKDALDTIRHVELKIPSCNKGSNESVQLGKNLVPFLSIYMSNLQTLRLWRKDDFPWTSGRLISNNAIGFQSVDWISTSVRPEFQTIPKDCFEARQRLWIKSLCTPKSIGIETRSIYSYPWLFSLVDEHVQVFREDLTQLVNQLTKLVFLDIYGQSAHVNVLAYRLMVEQSFPNSRFYIDSSRCRLWF